MIFSSMLGLLTIPDLSSRIFSLTLDRSMNVIAAASSATPPPMPPSFKTVRVIVKGRVQGVFFRDWTVENAKQLGLNGWVRNRRDGTVEAVFSGKPESVQEMVERRCRVGPPAAAVTKLDTFPADEVIYPDQGFQRKPTA
ncbi:acylphosphatase-1 [Carex littledalei]|uniref:Acylphosphatase n=1 Tax=Carex littledalei TaxID=544730 RepID=A0A833VLK6_9POAL|nr:acylphosphatase-1 [Carex littledalei]